ncbi:MAG TPA: CoA transferase, partial [Trebonia sp.]|nr:CoA transferase [Trebonia sp.]
MGVSSHGPLAGVRVIELGQLIAGPYCGQLLGDFGADVVKLEAPGAGDPMRRWGVIHEGKSLSWAVFGRNKRCIAADLHSAEGRDLAQRLIDVADVVVENFRPGTLERLGIGYEEMSARNPGIVYVRMSGYGQHGPYSPRAGYGSIGEAMGGLRYISGEPDRAPSRIGISIGDELAGLHGALGALMALRARAETGRGQVVDVSIYESVLALSEALIPEYALAGVIRQRTGAVLPHIAPSNLYPTADGEHILIAANQDTVFRRLAEAMGRPGLATDPRYATHVARGDHQAELDDVIADWAVARTTEALLEHLERHGVPAGRLYRAPDMLADPHFAARESIVTVHDEDLGLIPMPNVAPQLSQTPGEVRWPGPGHNAHYAEVVGEWLGPQAGSPEDAPPAADPPAPDPPAPDPPAPDPPAPDPPAPDPPA